MRACTHTHTIHTHRQAGYMRFGNILPFNHAEEGRVSRAALYSHKSGDFPRRALETEKKNDPPFTLSQRRLLRILTTDVSKTPTLPYTLSKWQERGRGKAPVAPRAFCSPLGQGSPTLSHTHAAMVSSSSCHHTNPVPVGCHSDNTQLGCNGAEAAVGKGLPAFPSAVFPKDAVPKVTLGGLQ